MLDLIVEGMSCGGCVRSVTGAVQTLDAQAKVEVDLAAKRVSVSSDAETGAIIEAIEAAGYDVEHRAA